MKRHHLVIFSFIVLLAGSCAKVGSISGGPVDKDPPDVVKSTPPNYSKNFEADDFEVEFDEFVVLKNINRELITSPPLEETPEIKLKGKSFVVEINNELEDSTTYTFNFGNGIADNHEGTVLKDFEYVFATGNTLDSLSLRGHVLNSFDFKPGKKPFHIMLYNTFSDSIPYLEKPRYVARTNDKGQFALNNIKAGKYKVFALQDANNNLLYDNLSEAIAFMDTAIDMTPGIIQERKHVQNQFTDSIFVINDTVKLETAADSSRYDSITTILNKSYFIDLLYFQEHEPEQYITSSERLNYRKLSLAFNMPVDSNFSVKPVYQEVTDWSLTEWDAEKDSMVIWLTDTFMIANDTLNLAVNYMAKDTANNPLLKTDTLFFRYTQPEEKRKRNKDQEEEEPEQEKMTLSANVKNNETIDLDKVINLTSSLPVIEIDTSLVQLVSIPDTSEQIETFQLIREGFKLQNFQLNVNWEPETKYKLKIFSGAIGNIYNLPHDTLVIPFTTRAEEYYGNIQLDITNVGQPVLLQLWNEKETKTIREKQVKADTSLNLEYLPAGKYIIKLVHDDNDNGKWDTGDYLKGVQPERVDYYTKEIEVRANWAVDINWEIH